MTTIADQANEVKAATARQLPAEVVAVFTSDQAALAAGGTPAGAVSVGETLAPFALPDASGKTRTLDELTAQGPAVIVFYRGGWCPYCNVTLRTYQRNLVPHLGGYSARLVAISPETPDASLTTHQKAELTYTVLSDAGAAFASSIGITFDPSDDGLATQRNLGVDIRTTPGRRRHRAADADRPDCRPRPRRAIRRHPPRLHRPHRGQRHPRRPRHTRGLRTTSHLTSRGVTGRSSVTGARRDSTHRSRPKPAWAAGTRDRNETLDRAELYGATGAQCDS